MITITITTTWILQCVSRRRHLVTLISQCVSGRRHVVTLILHCVSGPKTTKYISRSDTFHICRTTMTPTSGSSAHERVCRFIVFVNRSWACKVLKRSDTKLGPCHEDLVKTPSRSHPVIISKWIKTPPCPPISMLREGFDASSRACETRAWPPRNIDTFWYRGQHWDRGGGEGGRS